jgi:hypothetical protein
MDTPTRCLSSIITQRPAPFWLHPRMPTLHLHCTLFRLYDSRLYRRNQDGESSRYSCSMGSVVVTSHSNSSSSKSTVDRIRDSAKRRSRTNASLSSLTIQSKSPWPIAHRPDRNRETIQVLDIHIFHSIGSSANAKGTLAQTGPVLAYNPERWDLH